MGLHTVLRGLAGSWTGTKYLWMDPRQPPLDSVSIAEVGTVAGGNFLSIAYTWAHDGPQDGLILLNGEAADEGVTSVWLDSFHTVPGLMLVKSTIDDKGIAMLEGSYSAPPGPDWGWRIVIDPTPTPDFHLLMFNVIPDSGTHKAVEIVYTRLAPAS